jgi:hypothetical protein
MEVQTFLRLPNDSAFKDRRAFVKGAPDMILLHEEPQIQRPAEEHAMDHGYNPGADQFLPLPKRRTKEYVPYSVRPDEAWCTGCRVYHHVDCFHKNRRNRNGLQDCCINYRAAMRKWGGSKPTVSFNFFGLAIRS